MCCWHAYKMGGLEWRGQEKQGQVWNGARLDCTSKRNETRQQLFPCSNLLAPVLYEGNKVESCLGGGHSC